MNGLTTFTSMNSSTRPMQSPIWTNQRREMLLFLAQIFVSCWDHKQWLGTHWLCCFVVFGSIALTQQNGCMGAYRVIDLEQFPFWICRDKALTLLTKLGFLDAWYVNKCPTTMCLAKKKQKKDIACCGTNGGSDIQWLSAMWVMHFLSNE